MSTDSDQIGESWVEISSQPSSSSLSSIDNEIITTGLRVQPLDLRRHRRNTTLGTSTAAQVEAAVRRTTSSQDEYDESSSEDDAGVTSMREELQMRTGRLSPRLQMAGLCAEDVRFPSPSDDDEDDEDEEGTALGIAQPEAIFTPQSRTAEVGATLRSRRETGRDSYFPPQSRAQRFSETAHRAANDEALRASLTTLLSCAQAARSLPKPPYQGLSAGTRGGNEMQEFRLLPEAEILGTAPPPASTATQPSGQSPSTRPRSSVTASADEKEKSKEKGKSGIQPKTSRKKRASTHVHSTESGAEVHQVLTQNVSPTLFTWIVSAGVVVFVSVVGFGAGYAMGFEAGKEEGKLLACGREVPIRVRRFKWGTAA